MVPEAVLAGVAAESEVVPAGAPESIPAAAEVVLAGVTAEVCFRVAENKLGDLEKFQEFSVSQI